MKKSSWLVIVSLLFSLAIPTGIFAVSSDILNLSDEVSGKKDKQKELEENVEYYKQKIDEARKKTLTLKNQIEITNDNIKKTELEIQSAEMKINTLETDIISLNGDIKDTKKNIELQKDLVAYNLRELQRQGKKNPMEIILLHPSFSKFFNEMQNLEKLQANLNESIQRLKTMQGQLEQSQNNLKEKKNSTLELKKQLESKKAKLEAQKTAKTFLIGETFASESKFQSLLFDAQKEKQDLDSEINRLEAAIREKLKQSDLFPYGGSVVLTWPVPKNQITAYFNDPDYPYQSIFEHSGIDIRAKQGTPVTAPAPGYVLQVRNQDSWRVYNYIVLVHAGGISTLYLHLSQVYVKPDTYVSRGQVIGLSGGTPRTRGAGYFTTGPHLHFEVRQNTKSVDPLQFLVDL
ncbi:MAG: peptidoglycan DD-metalloendopeptidase family protein [Patescibacteria group bacterium]